MIFINPLLQTVCFVMAVLHEVRVPTHTLPLKHHKLVPKEFDDLEKAGII